MNDHEWLAKRFEENRNHLEAVAYRMLGSRSEAEDAVQEAWLKLSRADTTSVANLGGWLTTVVARVCLDMLRSRASRREDALIGDAPDSIAAPTGDAEQEAILADSVGLALLVVLETLAPAERVAFVLHDMFDLPFEEIAPIVGRTPTTARQLASRARRRIRGADPVPVSDRARQREVVEAFIAASQRGDFEALVAVLDPDVVRRADRAAVPDGVPMVVRGAELVARGALSAPRRATHTRFARLALVNGLAGVIVAPRGRLVLALEFTVRNSRIVEIDVIADPARLRQLTVGVIDA
jgi:RNA polymerase sigma-70 factor (ECF subfamily)